MEVKIAGFNIDKSLIDGLKYQEMVTPETISAAYARISRSEKSIGELRKEAMQHVDKARKSNMNIVFEMGHSSIAEHAVFNFDIVGISRYLTEFIQRSRLVSFTEKSQRYVTLKGDYVIPEELLGTDLKKEFIDVIHLQNDLYQKLFEKGKSYLTQNKFSGKQRELEGKAKEDARYVLALATETQMGMTANARNLAILLRRLDKLNLIEATKLREQIEALVKKIAPSLVRYTKADEYEKKLMKSLPKVENISTTDNLELLGCSDNPDEIILASLLFEKYGYDVYLLMNWVKNLSHEEKEKIFDKIFDKMKSFHSVPRSFELAHFTVQMTMSSSCYAQLKRHRMSTILKADYHPDKGYVIPPFIGELYMNTDIEKVMNKVHDLYFKLEDKKKGLGDYILTNGHKTAVIFHANLRELYHFSRLRSDKHAQWEIQQISNNLIEVIRKKAPLSGKFLMGKDEFKLQSLR
jgi:flavin-dependent thymidylate synthase